MNRILTIGICLLCFFTVIQAQDDCSYQPLQLNDIVPVWEHLIIDSTIIGYTSTADDCVDDDVFVDGMDQLSGLTDDASFVQDGYIYSITTINIEADQVGYLLEKIDLETGNLEWKTIVDCRLESDHYKPISGKVVDDKLHIYGVRSYYENNSPWSLETGFQPSYQFHRVYNNQSGDLLWENTPDEETELTPAVVYSEIARVRNFYYEDYWENIELVVWIDSGSVLTRQTIDTMGYILDPLDTIALGDWNEEWDKDLIIDFRTLANKLDRAPNGNYVYVQQFIAEPFDPRESKANITLYDQDFEILKKVDLVPFLEEGFEGIRVFKFDEEGVSLMVTYESSSEYNYLLLDADLNFIDYFEAKYNNNYVYINSRTNTYYKGSDVFIVSVTFPDDESKSHLRFFKSNNEGSLDSLAKLYIENENWGSIVTQMYVLDNGDYLVKLYYGCHNGFQFVSTFNSWMRIAASEFEGSVNVENHYFSESEKSFELYPNPAKTIVSVKSQYDLAVERVLISSMYGSTIMEFSDVNLRDFNVDLSELSPAMYQTSFLINGKWISKKIVKL